MLFVAALFLLKLLSLAQCFTVPEQRAYEDEDSTPSPELGGMDIPCSPAVELNA